MLEFKNFIIINDLIPRHDVMLPLGMTLFAPNQTSSKRRNSHQCHISDWGWELLQTNIHQNVIKNLTIKIKFNQFCPKTTGHPPKKWSFGRSNAFYKVNNLVVDIECPSWKSQFQRNVFLEGGCFRKENIFEFLTMHFILFNFEIGGYWTWSFSLNPFESSLDQMILFLVWVKEATKCTSSQGQVKILKSNL